MTKQEAVGNLLASTDALLRYSDSLQLTAALAGMFRNLIELCRQSGGDALQYGDALEQRAEDITGSTAQP